MEKYSKKQGWRGQGGMLLLLGLGVRYLTVCALLFCSAQVMAKLPLCGAVFPEGLQSHNVGGGVQFDWNAQLLDNPDSTLAAAYVEYPDWSTLGSCGKSACSNDSNVTSPLAFTFAYNRSTSDYRVSYGAQKTIASDGSHKFRHIEVASNSSLQFSESQSAYRIRRLTLGYKATVNLTAGDYWIDQLSIGSDARINVIGGTGTVRLFVKGNVTFPWLARVNIAADGAPKSPGRLFIYSTGNINLQAGSEVSALLYSEKKLELAQSKLFGAASFNKAHLGWSARVHYRPEALTSSQLPGVCRLEGNQSSGKEPEEPEHTELSACHSAFANGLQTHTADGSIRFGYNAQLHNAPSSLLATTQLVTQGGSSALSCITGECQASGTSAKTLEVGPFQYSQSQHSLDVFWLMSEVIFASDSSNYNRISVATGASLSIESQSRPLHIKHLSLGYASTLRLAPGDYWIERLELSAASRVKIIGQGTVRLFVKNRLQIPWMGRLNTMGESSQFIIYHYGNIHFNTQAKTRALVYGLGDATLDYQARVYGALNESHLRLNTDSHVTYEPQAIDAADFGTICDNEEIPDRDGDGYADDEDTFPDDPNEWADLDSDGIGNNSDADRDGDGIANELETQSDTDPDDATDTPPDLDGDGNPDGLDSDRDGDGHSNNVDAFPDNTSEWSDLDNDGVGDNSDPDRDGDGISNDYESQLGSDANDSTDTPSDLDGDAVPDSLDEDIDGDGYDNTVDAFPGNMGEWADLDGDGTGDNSDVDRDGDGIANDYESQLGTDPNSSADTPPDLDSDGIPDSVDSDRDGDGHANDADSFPEDASEWADLDRDGIGNNADTDRDGDGFDNTREQQANTDPDDIADYPDTVAPLLHVSNTSDEQLNARNVIVQGTVSDPDQPHSGIKGLTVKTDQFSDLVVRASVEGSHYRAEVPLALGDNRLTVTARDVSGNTTEIVHSVRRISPPHFSNISPSDGTVVTSDSVTLSGQVQTLLPLSEVHFYINEWQITPSGTGQRGIYAFSLPDVPLTFGKNVFVLRVQTADGADTQNMVLTHTPENPSSVSPPELSLVAPADGSQLQDTSFTVKGHVVSYAGNVTVKVNGEVQSAPNANRGDYYFESLQSFPEGQNILDVTITATDGLEKTSQLKAHYYRDNIAPKITLSGGLIASPAINNILESPYQLTGRVFDANLTSMTVNDQPVPLQPADINGRYSFSLLVPLEAGAELPLELTAYDLSGNRTSVEYILASSAQASIQPLTPEENAQFIYHGEPLSTQVAARVSALSEGDQVLVSVAGKQVILALAGTLASGDIALPSQAGDYSIKYQVRNSQQTLLASASHNIQVINEDNIAVKLLRHVPENNALNREPNQPVELYFNKPIDKSKLMVEVRESLHGKTYINNDALGTDFLNAKGYQLQDVYRDNELLAGAVSLLPGEKTLAYYAGRQFGFNADIYVKVLYDGDELTHFRFKVRPLPTFVIGGVADQFGQPLPGITVSLEGLNRTTTTDKNGSFAFGFQQKPEDDIPSGHYQLVVNPEFSAPNYGTLIHSVTVQKGRKNNLAMLRLPELKPDVPFNLIASSQSEASLAGDDLRLDLSDSRLLFNSGRTSGRIQFQFLSYEQLNTAMTPGAWPQWMFAGQPQGVKVEGPVGLDIKMPQRNGGYGYIPPNTEYVILLGYNSENEVIEPVGIGHIKNYRVISTGKVNIDSLDYLGYALVHPKYQTLLQSVAEGDSTLQQLIITLQE